MAGKSLSEKVLERVVLTSVGKATNKFGDRIFGWINEQLDEKKTNNKKIVCHDPDIDDLDNEENNS